MQIKTSNCETLTLNTPPVLRIKRDHDSRLGGSYVVVRDALGLDVVIVTNVSVGTLGVTVSVVNVNVLRRTHKSGFSNCS